MCRVCPQSWSDCEPRHTDGPYTSALGGPPPAAAPAAAGPVASLHVHSPGPGLVARCPACEEVVLRLVRGPGAVWLDLRGAVSLRVTLPD
ncbi:DUF6510 family protein [Nonomuraea sp. NPDC048916]|uniref:DUF6510 family protein n=1 Tax=Nonomuraea sp. NPDC048916 TaxID=3154232 RepID=UPI003409EEB6